MGALTRSSVRKKAAGNRTNTTKTASRSTGDGAPAPGVGGVRPALTLDGPLGLTLERGPTLSEGWRTAERPTLILPLGSCIVQLTGHLAAEPAHIDRALIALVPRGARYRLRALSPVSELLTLLIGDEAKQRACSEYAPHVRAAVLAEVLSSAQTLPRTRWFDELAHRYVFEREVCEKHASAAAAFLETEITKEIYFLGAERPAGETRATVVFEGSEIVKRARQWIEDNLFEGLRARELARAAHTSESTLLRAFVRELGVSPASYQRARRLDEAVLLLRAGRGTVGEVAARVGYANPSAFTVAFRRHFGVPPSSVRDPAPDDTRLPPHGRPPRRPSE
jgi:AraC-like DNA-binding protein